MQWDRPPNHPRHGLQSIVLFPVPAKHLSMYHGENETAVWASRRHHLLTLVSELLDAFSIGLCKSSLPNIIANDYPSQAFYPGTQPYHPQFMLLLLTLQSWLILLSSSELSFSIIPCPTSALPSKARLKAIASSKLPLIHPVEWSLSVLSTLQSLYFPSSLT